MSRPKSLIFLSTIPLFLSIAVYIYITSAMYALLQNSAFFTNWYDLLQSIGVILLGYLSDRFCRRRMALLVQIAGLILLSLIWIYPTNFWWILISGLFYNPLSILKAGLVDNFPKLSKVQLISLSFVAQIFPSCFYNKIVHSTPFTLMVTSFLFLIISTLFTLLFFYDKRDNLEHTNALFSVTDLTHKNSKRRFLYTILAFIPAQVVYLFADNLLDNYTQNPIFYSILSAASLIGAFLPLLYRRTPHTSVLTIIYGVGLSLACIPIICVYLFAYDNIGLPVQLILFSCLSSFSLPFVYDIVLNTVNASHRGLVCGILEALYSITSIINLAFVHFVEVNLLLTFLIVIFFYATSMVLQKRAE